MKINVKGPIIPSSNAWIYEWLGIEATSPQGINKILDNLDGEDVEVEINSGGGNVFAGSEIYTALKNYKGKVTVNIVGIAASAASVVAMAGETVRISPTAQMMIHNASAGAQGDYREMDRASQMLKGTNETISSAYRIKSKMNESELLEMMNNETFLTPKQALKYNLVDEIMFETEIDAVASFDNSSMIPQSVIDKLRNKLASEKKLENKKEDNEIIDAEVEEKKKEVENTIKELDLILKLR